MTGRWSVIVALLAVGLAFARPGAAQAIGHRGFIDGSAFLFPQEALNDPTQVVGDFIARGELFIKPAGWLQLAGGLDLRANTHDQVDDAWRLDVSDRGTLRPRVSLRRASATVKRG